MTPRPILVLLAAIGILQTVAAQDAGYRRQLEAYREGLRSSRSEERLASIAAFQRCGEPAALEALIEDARDARERHERWSTEARKLGRYIDDELKERVYDRGEPGKYNPKDLEQAERKLAPTRARLAEVEKLVEREAELILALEEAVGGLVASIPEARRLEAAEILGRLLERERKPERQAGILRAMGHADDARVRDILIEQVMRAPVPALRLVALEALRVHPDPASERAAIHALGDDAWPVRAAALPLLAAIGGRDCIAPLIDALEREDGRLITEVIETLKALTKRSFHDNVVLWRSWWAEHGASFAGRGRNAGVSGGEEVAGGGDAGKAQAEGNYFYGIETRSKAILYILDVSGSMQWRPEEHWWNGCGRPEPPPAPEGERKMDRSIRELLQSIASLPKDARFNIIFFSGDVSLWKRKMQKATAARKAEARAWATRIEPIGGTNISDSLEKAFEVAGRGAFDRHYQPAVDTIFFLSDGDPSAGRTTDKAEILRDVQEWNRLARIQIHCVGLGPNADVPYIRFMADLARQNQGQFVLVSR